MLHVASLLCLPSPKSRRITDPKQGSGCSSCAAPLHRRVTNVALSALLASSPGMRRLSLYWNLNVTNDALFAAAAMCAGLRAVNLSGCKNVTDSGVRALARGCPGITALDLTR